MWFLWLISMILGALAVAVSLSVIAYNQTALFEATHDSWWVFMVEALPYLWFTILALMLALAALDLRHSRRGYRYPLWQIVGSSAVVSFGFGLVLHALGTGYYVDHTLGQKWGFYMSQQKYEQARWQNPGEGRLVGAVVGPKVDSPDSSGLHTVEFVDVTGVVWETVVVETAPADLELMLSNERVHLFGIMDETQPPRFYACGALKAAAKADPAPGARERYLKEAKRHWYEIHRKLNGTAGQSRRCTDQALIRRLNSSFGF